jgi:hypothetical protein
MALPPDAITQTPRGYRACAYPGANRDSRDPSAAARVAASAGPPAHSPANCFDQSGSGKVTYRHPGSWVWVNTRTAVPEGIPSEVAERMGIREGQTISGDVLVTARVRTNEINRDDAK